VIFPAESEGHFARSLPDFVEVAEFFEGRAAKFDVD
jgi:hypothetical protein